MTDVTGRLSTALADRYRIEREIGAGGMATVYLAHDVRHDRKVALKVLRPELSAILGAERFLAEIKTTANLQHPHILPLHDSGEADGTVFYVMPFVEGESLRDRIRREKQLPVDEAVRITREVADALDYAHRHGVVHRDIKPENILLHDGRAQVADFGIALAVSRSDGGTRMTETGMSLGTPHYMAPEQAMGEREITAKADVYALGCVLYEMLTGEPPFTGPTAQAIVARVMTEEPRSLTLQRRTIPPHVEAAVGMALAKLPADRFPTASAFAEALDTPGLAVTRGTHAVPAGIGVGRWRAIAFAASTVAVVAVLFAARAAVREAPPAPVARFRVMLDSTSQLFFTGQSNPPRVTLSPDGSELVYVAATGAGPVNIGNQGSVILGMRASGTLGAGIAGVLVQRRLGDFTPHELPGTSGAWAPQFAPDGERVAFVSFVSRRVIVKVVSLAGGPPTTVLDSAVGSAVAWGPGDHLYYVHATEPAVYRVAASGGAPERVVRLQGPAGASYAWPAVLPGGAGIILTVSPGTASSTAGGVTVQVFDLRTGVSRASVSGAFGRYASSGHLVYATPDGTLMGAALNPRDLALIGRPVALLDGVDVRNETIADLALSATGALSYTTRSFNAPEAVAWVNRDGSVARVDPAWTRDWEFEGLALSPDGRRAAVVIETGNRGDVWVKQLDRGPLTRLTLSGDYNGAPAWTPDGRNVTYLSLRGDRREIRMAAADASGSDSLLFALDRPVHFAEWSRDGRWLLVSVGGDSDDILAMRVGRDSLPQPLLAAGFNEFLPALSPDGRWLAYVSDESGRAEVYVRPFPDIHAGRWQITTEGGTEPIWSANGRELYVRSLDRGSILAADVSRGPGSAAPRVLTRLPATDDFEGNPRNRLFDVTPGGRFLMIQRANATDVSGDLVVVLNWFTELREKMGR